MTKRIPDTLSLGRSGLFPVNGPLAITKYITPVNPAYFWHKATAVSFNDAAAAEEWDNANQAIYTPMFVSRPVLVDAFWWGTGSAGSGNFDAGIYDCDSVTGAPRTRLEHTGSTAAGTASTLTATAPSGGSFSLSRGWYWFALAHSQSDAVSNTIYRLSSVPHRMPDGFIYSENSALPLPATATPAGFGTADANCATPLAGIRVNQP